MSLPVCEWQEVAQHKREMQAREAAMMCTDEPHEVMVARVEKEMEAIFDTGIRINPIFQVSPLVGTAV